MGCLYRTRDCPLSETAGQERSRRAIVFLLKIAVLALICTSGWAASVPRLVKSLLNEATSHPLDSKHFHMMDWPGCRDESFNFLKAAKYDQNTVIILLGNAKTIKLSGQARRNSYKRNPNSSHLPGCLVKRASQAAI